MKKWHLWLAVSIGLVVIVGMMIREFDVEVLSRIDLSPRFFLGVVMGVLLFAVMNLMLTLRFRHLCQRKLSVAEAFRINVLCEFTSAVTPSAVGGSGLAFVYLNREEVSAVQRRQANNKSSLESFWWFPRSEEKCGNSYQGNKNDCRTC